MIDNFAIILFGLCIVFLAVRAIRLDQTLPWFDNVDEQDGVKQSESRPSDPTK